MILIFKISNLLLKKNVERGDYKMRSPAHWMIYSLVVRQLQNRIESYEECVAIAKECGIRDTNELMKLFISFTQEWAWFDISLMRS